MQILCALNSQKVATARPRHPFCSMHLAQQPGGFSSHCTYVQCIKPLNVMVGPHHRRQHLSSSRCWSVSNGTNSCSSSESSGPANGAASKDEAESKVKQLQLCNSIQKGYLSRQGQERQDKDSVCCWGGTDLPKHHTSRSDNCQSDCSHVFRCTSINHLQMP